jgi:transposase
MTGAADATCSTLSSRAKLFWPTAPMTAMSCAKVSANGAWANIKSMPNRKKVPAFSSYLYRYRNLVRRFFNKIKHYRAVATRYDKRPENFLAGVKLVSFRIWMRSNESVT